MEENKEEKNEEEGHQPLVFHIRAKRQWYENRQLSQEDLAELAGLSPRQLSTYEHCSSLPPAVKSLFKIALALRLRIEELVDPRLLEKLKEEIEQRRVKVGLTAPTEARPNLSRHAA